MFEKNNMVVLDNGLDLSFIVRWNKKLFMFVPVRNWPIRLTMSSCSHISCTYPVSYCHRMFKYLSS